MGQGSSSSNSTSITNKTSVEAMVENIMACRTNTVVAQKFVLSGSYNTINNFKMVQYLKLSADCSQDTKSVADLQQSVANAVQQSAAAQSVSLIGVLGASSSEVNTNILSEIRSKITQRTVLDIINSTNAEQVVVISGNNNIVTNFEMSQTAEILAKNCQNVINQLSSVQAVDNAAKSSSTATQTNFISDILSSIFKGLTSLSLVWMIVIIVGIIVLAIVVIKGGPIMAFFGKGDAAKKGGGIFDAALGTA